MGTSLLAITNCTVTGKEPQSHWDSKLEAFKNGNLELDPRPNDNEWKMFQYNDPDYFSIEFETPLLFEPCFMIGVGEIGTFYRYSLMYSFSEWTDEQFDSFRLNMFNTMKIMGGTEVIYLADQGDLGSCFNMCLSDESGSYYNDIKQALIKKYGKPVTNYRNLDPYYLDYYKITEFILDDFSDLK